MLPADFNLQKRFYYNRLDTREKELYAFWLEALLAGHRTIAFRLFRDFNPFEEKPTFDAPQFILEEHGCEHIDFCKVFDSMLWDCPELYFVYHYVPNYDIRGYIRLGGDEPDFPPEEIAEINAKLDELLHRFDDITDPFELELAVHDYITKNYDYDTKGAENRDTEGTYENRAFHEKFTVVGLLKRGVAVCAGLIKLIQFVLQRRGLEVADIIADAGDEEDRELHSWLAVKLGDSYYHLDLTYNENSTLDPDEPQYMYFNVTDKEIMEDHFFTHEEYPEIVCNSTEYNYYHKKGLYFEKAYDVMIGYEKFLDSIRGNEVPSHYYFRTSIPDEKKVINAIWHAVKHHGGIKHSRVAYWNSVDGYYAIEIKEDARITSEPQSED